MRDYALTGREGKTATHAIDLAETTFNAAVNMRVGERQGLKIMNEALGVVVKYNAGIEQPFRIECSFEAFHHAPCFITPFSRDKRSHIAPRTVLGFE